MVRDKSLARLLLPGLILAALAAPARADDPAARYQACIEQAQRDPAAAFATATAWEQEGGGNAARHCAAVAQFNREDYRAAARSLTELAGEIAAIDAGRAASLYGEAGRAWVLAGSPERAIAALDAGIALRPRDAGLHVVRSYARIAQEDDWAAIDDLDRSLELAPDNAEIYLLRAAAYRHLGNYDLALDDIERTLARAPGNPEALLERGNIRRLRGDTAGARADWEQVKTLAPGSPAAQAAEVNLERTDTGAPGSGIR